MRTLRHVITLTLPEKCNTFKNKFTVLKIDMTGSLSLLKYMINSYQTKHTRHGKGCLNSYINTQCRPLWWQRRHVFSHANGHKGAECHPATDCPKHLAPIVPIRPFEQGRTVGMRETGWIYRRISSHVGHNVRWRVAAFSSDLWNIPTPIDQVLDGRLVQTLAKIDFCANVIFRSAFVHDTQAPPQVSWYGGHQLQLTVTFGVFPG